MTLARLLQAIDKVEEMDEAQAKATLDILHVPVNYKSLLLSHIKHTLLCGDDTEVKAIVEAICTE
jgi:allophanate hydrolase subunit 1